MYLEKFYLIVTLVLLTVGLVACGGETTTSKPPSEATATPEPAEEPTAVPTKVLAEIPEAAAERGFFLLPEFHEFAPEEEQLMNDFLKVVQSEPVPLSLELEVPLQIAFIFPSLEPGDGWARLNVTIRKRLDDLDVPYEVTEFLIEMGEHEQQTAQIEEVLAGTFDYVVIGPSEYELQKANLERLAQQVPTLVMNVVNPFVDSYGTDKMALTHVGFDHSVGAKVLCEWVINETGGEGTFALVHFQPGLIDDQRSGVFADCVQKNSNMELVDEYEANGERDKAFIGANVIINNHPEVTMIHAGNTAVALGILDALKEQDLTDKVLLNGWGGGADELTAIIAGEIDVTAFRVNDDWGVSVAEAIKADIEGKQVPVVIAATIKGIDYRLSAEEIAQETDYAFRYSGKLE